MLDGYCRRGVVRLAWPLPSERNGRVSGVLMAWVGRLRARASNCRPPIVLSLFPECSHCLAGGLGILCCLPTEWNSIVSLPLSARCPLWVWGGLQARYVFLACLASFAGLLRRTETLPVLSDAERHARVRGLGLCLPKLRICPLTRTTAAAVLIPS